jgi:hypothetical protein
MDGPQDGGSAKHRFNVEAMSRLVENCLLRTPDLGAAIRPAFHTIYQGA